MDAQIKAFGANDMAYNRHVIASALNPAFPACPFTDAATLMRTVLATIAHCHKRGVIHRDLKLENFLYGGPDGKLLKLCDFGLSDYCTVSQVRRL
jgi:serine/threonine protein kinase